MSQIQSFVVKSAPITHSGALKNSVKTTLLEEEEEDKYSEEEEDLEDYCKGGYHPVRIGDVFNDNRYIILRKLGWGHFSTLSRYNRPVALKIVKSAPHYTETALDEIKLLDKAVTQNPTSPNRTCVVELLDWFKHRGPHGIHVCMAFEVLGPNLLTLIRQYHHRGIPAPVVQRIAKQILQGLDYLHRECGIIHTDLKPENVLICIDVEKTMRKFGMTSSYSRIKKDKVMDINISKSSETKSSNITPNESASISQNNLKDNDVNTDDDSDVDVTTTNGPIQNLTRNQKKKAKYLAKKKAQKLQTADSISLKDGDEVGNVSTLVAPSLTQETEGTMEVDENENKKEERWIINWLIFILLKKNYSESLNRNISDVFSSETAAVLPPISPSPLGATKETAESLRLRREGEGNNHHNSKEEPHAHLLRGDSTTGSLYSDHNSSSSISSISMSPPIPRTLSILSRQEQNLNLNIRITTTSATAPASVMEQSLQKVDDENSKPESINISLKSTPSTSCEQSGNPSIENKQISQDSPKNIKEDIALLKDDVETKREKKLARKERKKKRDENIHVKIADLGNACWIDLHFTNDIQTRQYRAPEAILGANYDSSADMWSMGCMIFELLTGDYLFDPQTGAKYSKDDDHIAQIIELLGPFPKSISLGGKYSSEIFNRRGELRHIHKLRYWKLADVLKEKYHFSEEDAKELSAFIMPMVEINPEKRATAQQMLNNSWILKVADDSSESEYDSEDSDSSFSSTSLSSDEELSTQREEDVKAMYDGEANGSNQNRNLTDFDSNDEENETDSKERFKNAHLEVAERRDDGNAAVKRAGRVASI
ncbi:serine/threonine protein kinase, CMGC group [Nowakowskiella sp. JEL0078]|nr:serine/threonine protein kinase, CMGC group [Nowakowskiella sp. JEL0078]